MKPLSRKEPNMHKKILIPISVLIFLSLALIIYTPKFNTAQTISATSATPLSQVSYNYEPISTWQNKEGYGVSDDAVGVHTIAVHGFKTINSIPSNLNASSLLEITHKLGLKLLTSRDINPKYLNIWSTDINNTNYNDFIIRPSFLRISTSNYYNFKCADFIYPLNQNSQKDESQEHDKCLDDTKNKLNIDYVFATQYATLDQLENFAIHLADFEENETKIFNSSKLKTKIYHSRWNEYLFVYDNIIYILDNHNNDYTEKQMLEMIENMT